MVFIFLQNWRATLIPLLTVPVAVVGTFALFPLLGFSINITSMFGLVLAIGIVVDDAIVVVEAVQRHIDDGMPPREATMRAMEEVSAPVVAIAFILAAVFIPVAFIGGISGQIYKQFALTIAVSVLHVGVQRALAQSGAVRAAAAAAQEAAVWLSRPFDWFNRAFDWTTNRYLSGVGLSDSPRPRWRCWRCWCSLSRTGGLFSTCRQASCRMRTRAHSSSPCACPMAHPRSAPTRRRARSRRLSRKIPGVDRYFVLGGLDIATGTSNSNVAP